MGRINYKLETNIMIENNGITPNLNTQVQITENDVQEVMNEHPLFKVMVENKALRRIIQGQSEYIKDIKKTIIIPRTKKENCPTEFKTHSKNNGEIEYGFRI